MRHHIYALACLVATVGAATTCGAADSSQTGSVSKVAATPAPEVPAAVAAPAEEVTENTTPSIVIETSMGTITAELWADKAPLTVANILAYVDEGYYDGLIFHRVIDGFMIQGGGFDTTMTQKKTKPPVRNEAGSDRPNARGTLAMARTSMIDSATSQFFINLVDNTFLNHRNKSPQGFGYCVFGKVTSGMDVVDAIAKVKTGMRLHFRDVPTEDVVIKSIRRSE